MFQNYYDKHLHAVELAVQDYLDAPTYLLHQLFHSLKKNHLY